MIEKYIERLNMLPHPEGGFYKETYRSTGLIETTSLPAGINSARNFSTAIYFLLAKGDYSAFHRIKSDECWHFYDGDVLLIHEITVEGEYKCTKLGKNIDVGECFQYVVPAGHWFASEPALGSEFSLVGCTVAPGFDFNDFEMARKEELIKNYPTHRPIIERLSKF